MAIGTNSKYPNVGIRGKVRSTFVDDLSNNVKADLNTLEQSIADAAIGTTNAETTAARPYHTALKGRLDTIGAGQVSFIDGFFVQDQSSPNMTVQIAVGTGTIDGIEVEKTSITNTGTITAPTTNPRFDVVYIDNTNTIGIASGSESADPVYPTISQTQKPLAIIYITPATVTIPDSIITDARTFGAYYKNGGAFKWKWKAQDAIDDMDNDVGGQIELIGEFYEEIDIGANNNLVIDGYAADVYRISDSNSCITSINTVSNETTGNKLFGFSCFGNGKAGALTLYEFAYTDQFIMEDCTGDGNSSSGATGKDLELTDCDKFIIKSTKMASRVFTTVTEGIAEITDNVELGTGTAKEELSLKSTTANTGITVSGDVNLYRSASDTWTTDNTLKIGGSSGKTTLELTSATNDTGITIDNVNLFCNTSDDLETDDTIVVPKIKFSGSLTQVTTEVSSAFNTTQRTPDYAGYSLAVTDPGVYAIGMSLSMQITANSIADSVGYATLSEAQDTEDDPLITGSINVEDPVTKNEGRINTLNIVNITSSTTYYLNIWINYDGALSDAVVFVNDGTGARPDSYIHATRLF